MAQSAGTPAQRRRRMSWPRIRAMNRHMCVGEAMRFALNSLAVVAPDWLLAHCDAEWIERYGHRIEESRLPKSEGDRLALAEVMGAHGWKVLTAVFDPLAPCWLREIPAVQVLRQIWVQNDWMEEGQLRWRDAENIPPATLFINSPYDPQAHLGKKRSTLWSGDIRSPHRNLRTDAPSPDYPCGHHSCP